LWGDLMPEGLRSFAKRKSPWVMHVPCGGCNGCDIEVVASLTPKYDIERFGVLQKGTPRHADVLLVTGIVTAQVKDRLKRLYDLTPGPKHVVAFGSCALDGDIFHPGYEFAGPLDEVVPVSIYVPGCPPRPEALIDGLSKLLRPAPRKKRIVTEVFAGGETQRPSAEPTDRGVTTKRGTQKGFNEQLAEFILFTGLTLAALGLYYEGFNILVVAAVFLMGPIVKLLSSIFRR
jgi:Ni,Fe-hydrogenase III small subunit